MFLGGINSAALFGNRTMNAYETAQQLGLTGTDSEIAAALKATGLTAQKISLGQLTLLMRDREMLTKLTYEDSATGMKWNGSVINMIIGLRGQSHPALAAINKWFSHITDPRSETFDTTDQDIASEFWTLAQNFGGIPTMPSSADFAAVADLGGGWLFSDLTVEQFAVQRQASIDTATAAELAAEWATLQNESIHPAASNRADLVSALRSAADTLEAG